MIAAQKCTRDVTYRLYQGNIEAGSLVSTGRAGVSRGELPEPLSRVSPSLSGD
jgi:hypothetical protein